MQPGTPAAESGGTAEEAEGAGRSGSAWVSSVDSFDQGAILATMELLMDVRVGLSVQLGRTQLSIRDVLGLAPGSVVELDKPADELVDILVNDRLVAHGEVVVVDDNFGVRVLDIVSPSARLGTESVS